MSEISSKYAIGLFYLYLASVQTHRWIKVGNFSSNLIESGMNLG